MELTDLTKCVQSLITYIGDDPNREGLKNTPLRVLSSWGQELFSGYHMEVNLTTFEDGACDEMVVLRDVEFFSHCEHHLMLFSGVAHIGYLPKKKVVGVSKLARVLDMYSRRLQIQERIGQQVTDYLMQYLQPEGCGCILEARHHCMVCRGVQKQQSTLVTSSMRGCFLTNASVKNEFLRMAGK